MLKMFQIDDSSDADSSIGDVEHAYVISLPLPCCNALILMIIRSSSVSVSSSVFHFVEEFGRTFHKYREGSEYRQPFA